MRTHYKFPDARASFGTVLCNYLTLANFDAQFGLARALSGSKAFETFQYSVWEPWTNALNDLDRMASLFAIDAPLGQAMVARVSGVCVYEYFWGPLSQILNSRTRGTSETQERPIDPRWFVDCVIPQWNLGLAKQGITEVHNYAPVGWIGRVFDSFGQELS